VDLRYRGEEEHPAQILAVGNRNPHSGDRSDYCAYPPAGHPSVLPGGPPSAEINSVEGIAGLIVCMAGFALAVWARRHLGRNWGMPMSLKEGHELVTTGPYRYVRHPIYTGMLLAILGSALVNGPIWVVVFAGMAIYCVYCARTEESLMLKQFPEQSKCPKMSHIFRSL
jgi:protein-S-isoprenylcysteine O-methyltransferase Ste14